MVSRAVLPAILLTLCGLMACADEATENEVTENEVTANDVQQIETEVAAYVEAFNAKDAAALAQHWSETGVYVRPDDGTRLLGREAIQKEFAATFADQPAAILKVKVETIRFVTPDVAIEEGRAEVTSAPDTIPSRTDYTAVHVKRDGKWQIDSIRETDLPEDIRSAADHLNELAWLVGDWSDQSADATLETSVTWTKNKAFLSYTFKVATGNVDELEGTQVVGWDPVAKTIRSWMFDSEGGFGEGVWSHDGDRWVVKFHQVLADGSTASSTNVYTYVDADSFTWQSIGREVDGEFLPNVDPVTLVRKPTAELSAAE
ncbi:MAG TPA: SgcJ/EcaC family oxidoreductase [Pirellulales bacterium]|nr:SgcJ/EcaC family oxidoreductase [Pirellulales bacterium]